LSVLHGVVGKQFGMTRSLHPAASDHLPSFITAPGDTDVLMVVMAIILLLFALAFGILYLRLHALPERFAHHKVQFEIVCILGLIAMFTHMHIFWIAGLLLAFIEFPDFSTPLNRIAGSAEKIARVGHGEGAAKRPLTKDRVSRRHGGDGHAVAPSISKIAHRTQEADAQTTLENQA
jgi:hypothetical protein